jgi:hypothetical protein
MLWFELFYLFVVVVVVVGDNDDCDCVDSGVVMVLLFSSSVTQDVNKRDSVNDTPLCYACTFFMRTHERVLSSPPPSARFGQDNVVKFLLQAKADVNARNIEARRLLLSQRQFRCLVLTYAHAHAHSGPHAIVSGR